MAARSMWNGAIAFGQVRIPVKLFAAVSRKTIRFREVHLADSVPLQHRRICTAEDTQVPYEQVVKGYEVAEGEYVVLDPEEVRAAAADRGKVIELDEFVDVTRIDPVLFERTYYLGYRDDPDPYSLLRSALSKCDRAGIGRLSMRGREYLVAVRALERHLVLHTMKFHDEVISPAELDLPEAPATATEREVKMAQQLIDGLTEDFDPAAWEDRYREAVMDLIEAKAAGKSVPAEKPAPDEGSDDLSSALRDSLERQKAKA